MFLFAESPPLILSRATGVKYMNPPNLKLRYYRRNGFAGIKRAFVSTRGYADRLVSK